MSDPLRVWARLLALTTPLLLLPTFVSITCATPNSPASAPGALSGAAVPYAGPTREPGPQVEAAAVQAGASQDWWSAARAEIEQEEYWPSPCAGGLQAPNRGQGLRTSFLGDHIEISPRLAERGAWRLQWRTCAVGRADPTQPAAAPAAPVADGTRVSYRRPGWTEWFENDPAGLEQGFTLTERPPGEGALRIEVGWSGDLCAVPIPDTQALEFRDEHGVAVLRYGGLAARDARGQRLETHLEAGEQGLTLAVMDEGLARR